MTLDWYPFFIVDYRRDTRHLTLEQDGAYRRLIDEYMMTREPLPNDDAALARIVGIPKAEWDRLAPAVRRFFRMRNDKLFHKRCEREIRAQNTRHNRNSKRAQKGGMAKAFKDKQLRAFSTLVSATLQYKDKPTTTEYVDRGPTEERRDVASPHLIAHEGGKRRG